MEELLDINEVAKLTKISKPTLRRYVLLKQIPFHKVVGAIRFRASEIEEWVNKNGNLAGIKAKPLEQELPFVNDTGGEMGNEGHGQGD